MRVATGLVGRIVQIGCSDVSDLAESDISRLGRSVSSRCVVLSAVRVRAGSRFSCRQACLPGWELVRLWRGPGSGLRRGEGIRKTIRLRQLRRGLLSSRLRLNPASGFRIPLGIGQQGDRPIRRSVTTRGTGLDGILGVRGDSNVSKGQIERGASLGGFLAQRLGDAPIAWVLPRPLSDWDVVERARCPCGRLGSCVSGLLSTALLLLDSCGDNSGGHCGGQLRRFGLHTDLHGRVWSVSSRLQPRLQNLLRLLRGLIGR